MKLRLTNILSSLLMLTLPGLLPALETDRQQPTYIEADQVEIDDAKGISIYQGNVILTQGSIRLESDILTVFNAEGETERYVADGEPARYKQTMEKDGSDLVATALNIEYQLAREIVTLTQQAHVTQHDDEFMGERIVYNMRTSKVQASSAATSGGDGGRVRMVIQPRDQKAP
ncbi:MAG: lipopolysaccharide transport periplasmic protein LptA [Gammaproteobacteria bacterium]|nr:lipopolysaccharide transport periplasmic protein LptA [Gammaproteobacteria bacterium]